MAEFFLWYGLIWLIGLVGLPFSFALFSRLPDRGYAFSRPLGLLLITIVIWWVGNLKLLPFNANTCWIMLDVVALLSVPVWWLKRREIAEWFGQWRNLRLVLGAELFFFAGYAFIVNFRSFLPALNQSEKFFDYGFINAIYSSTTLPPPDPWFMGAPMNYYYGGQLYMATFCKLSGTDPVIGYNLGMGLVYAMAAIACYGLGSNLFGLARNKGRTSLIGGITGASFIMILGNLDALRQLLDRGIKEMAEGKFPFYFNWPATARMIYDPMPPPNARLMDILTEYPIYSFLNGDLHAHLLDLPYVVLILGFILNMFVAPKGWVLGNFSWRTIPQNLASGLIIGAPYLINGGDFLTYAGLAFIALALAELRGPERWRDKLFRLVTQAVRLGAMIVLVYLPFFLNFDGMVKGEPQKEVANTPIVGWFSRYLGRVTWRGTFLAEFVTMYGLFFFSIVPFFVLALAHFWRANAPAEALKPVPTLARVIVNVAGVILLALSIVGLVQIYNDASAHQLSLNSALVTLMSLPMAALALWPGVWARVRSTFPRQQLIIELMALLVLLAFGPFLKWELLGPTAALFYFSLKLGLLAWRESAESQTARLDSLFFLFMAAASFISLFCEVFYIRDIYNNRFNTMMKFWYQTWMLYGVAAIYATWRVFNWARQTVAESQAASASSENTGNRNPLPQARPNLGANFADFGRVLPQLEPELVTPLLYQTSEMPEIRTAPARGSVSPRVTTASRSKILGGWWRWPWLAGLLGLAFFACACLTLGYWEATNHYSQRQGLNGEVWYSQDLAAEYPAMKFLRQLTLNHPEKRGIVLEANGMNYSWYDRISVYTGLPTLVGWPFHELQWRQKMDELVIWNAWLDMDKIYATTNNAEAIELLHRHNVRYVFVGLFEQGKVINPNVAQRKDYSPEALAKFGSFMKTIYADPANNIYIYAFD
jgi:YYY domain-containing protein